MRLRLFVPRPSGVLQIALLAAAGALLVPNAVYAQASGEGSVSLAYGTVGPGAAVEDLDGNEFTITGFSKRNRTPLTGASNRQLWHSGQLVISPDYSS